MTSNSCGSREPLKSPSSVPLSQTRAQDSTPSKRSTASPSSRPAVRQVEDPAMVTGRVLVGNARRIDREGVADVGVRGRAVALEHPVPGHRDGLPAGGVVALLGEFRLRRRRRTVRGGSPKCRSARASAHRTRRTRHVVRGCCRPGRSLRSRACSSLSLSGPVGRRSGRGDDTYARKPSTEPECRDRDEGAAGARVPPKVGLAAV